jgi:hypothetical protein
VTTSELGGRPAAGQLQVLLSPPRKLGWEYVDPGDPPPSPLLNYEPLMRMDAIAAPPATSGPGPLPVKWIVGLGVLTFMLLPGIAQAPGLLLIPLIGAGVIFGPRLFRAAHATQPMGDWQHRQHAAQQQYDYEMAQWRHQIAEHNARATAHLASQPVWWPISAETTSRRLDVVGGLPDGWMHLLATSGAGMLAAGEQILVLDLSGQSRTVATGLLEIAGKAVSHRAITLPEAGAQLDLLAGLSPEEIADLLAAAVGSLRSNTDRAAQMTDSDILFRAIRALRDTPTPARVLAAVEVLARTSISSDLLSPHEIEALSEQVDLVGSGEAVQERLRLLRIGTEILVRSGSADVDPAGGKSIAGIWAADRLSVIRTADAQLSRKEFLDQVLALSLLQTLRRATPAEGERRSLVVVAGDGLGERVLDDLARQTQRLGIRLVLFFEHCRDDILRLIGTAGSATAFMRLGNGTEASAAADQIGRDHSFKLSQITKQLGQTDTVGGSASYSRGVTESESQQVNNTSSGPLQQSSSSGTSFSRAVADTATQMSNWSTAQSVTQGTTQQRVYEFVVEPVALQSLPVTAFILVQGRHGQDRAVVGDCNAAIALADRVAQVARA